MKLRTLTVACALALAAPLAAVADRVEKNSDGFVDIRNLFTGANRIEQADLANMTRDEIRLAGMRMFTNPFMVADGFGDGDADNPAPSGVQGERGTLQGNGTFQRIGGLDGQTCLECHSIISRRTVPMTFGIGGVGGINNTVLGAGGNTFVDLNLQGRSADSTSGVTQQQANIDGRVINPPFIFGAGGIEHLANEMTEELQGQLHDALAAGDGTYDLSAKDVSFGSITIAGGAIVTDPVTGNAVGAEGTASLNPSTEEFMVVQPFGRKGNELSTRTFDIGALSFHFGMGINPLETDEHGELVLDANGDPIEIRGTDHDDDGVTDEVTQGELSVLSVFVGTAQTPFQTKVKRKARRGLQVMNEVGCTECHIPKMETKSKTLGFRFPEIANEPFENVHTSVDLTKKPMSFEKNDQGGVTIELFADLKRHYMGKSLEEFNGDGMFTTMRLWGVADTAPYLHDGRAFNIRDAIAHHGGVPNTATGATFITDDGSEAFNAVSGFLASSEADQKAVLAFLDTLRSPNGTFPILQRVAKKVARKQR